MPKEKQKSVSVKFPADTIDWIEEERARARPILPASEVVRREFEKGRSGISAVDLPALDIDEDDDVDKIRAAMDGPAGTRPSLAFSRALLRFYDEVMAMTGGASAEPKNAAGFTAAEQAEIDDYAAKAQAEAAAKVVPIAAGSRPKYEVRR